MKSRFTRFALYAAACPCWLAIMTGLMFSVLRAELRRETFFSFYMAYGTERRIGISPEDSTNAAMALVDYMEGRRDSIQLTVTERGREVEMYNRREMAHMEDVRGLYQGFAKFVPGSLAALGILVLLRVIAGRSGGKGFLSRSYLRALGIFALALAGLGAWAAFDFTSFWTAFHRAFFTNDLWLLNPAADRMIRICPESLFSSLAEGMAFRSAVVLSLLGLAAAKLRGKKGNSA